MKKQEKDNNKEVTEMTEETPVEKSDSAETKTESAGNANENVVFVGNKPVMNYVLAVVTQVNNGQKEVHVEARGRAISRAVDVAEIVRKRFLNDLAINKIDIGTEELQSKENESVNVSTIRISLGN